MESTTKKNYRLYEDGVFNQNSDKALRHYSAIGETVTEQYALLYKQAEEIIGSETYYVAALSNLSALIYQSIEEVNWAGFYLMDHGSLLVGPFQGKPACIRIEIGKGVCGTAVHLQKVQRVDDVHEFPGHIACDSESRSEIVVPIWCKGNIVGVLDIDSPVAGRFSQEDVEGLCHIVGLIGEKIDFGGIRE